MPSYKMVRIADTSTSKTATIDPLHKWRLSLNHNTLDTSLASGSRFQTKDFSHECEA